MKKIKNNGLDEIMNYVPIKLHKSILRYSHLNIQEIRFRLNKPVSIMLGSKNVLIDNTKILKEDIETIFENICEHSVYVHQNEINNGFVSIKNGCRVGVCGTAVADNNEMISVKNITSINFRIAKEFIGCAEKFLNICKGSFIICGPPASVKTTILRDIARSISMENKKVCIIDERFEISGFNDEFTLGNMTDVLRGYNKAHGVVIALRTLSPQVIIFDEIGTLKECESVFDCLNCGVDIITSVHCSNLNEFSNRPVCEMLLKSGLFSYLVFLGSITGEFNAVYKIDGEGKCELLDCLL